MKDKELTMEEKHSIMLEIMKDIDKFCRSNGIRYSIADGTMLGAVRHGGFIPWDDDADLIMPREDFDRFVKSYQSDRFHLLFNTRGKDEYLVYGFSKVIDPTTYVDDRSSASKYGVFVDVFPLDRVPDDPEELKAYTRRVRHLHNRLHHRQKKDLLSIFKSYWHSLDWWWNHLNDAIYDGRYSSSPLLASVITANKGRTRLDESAFDSLINIKFEDYEFLGVKDYHNYLAMIFGPDYMTPKKWAHNLKMYRK